MSKERLFASIHLRFRRALLESNDPKRKCGYPLHSTNLSRLAENYFVLTNQEALRSKEIFISGIGRISRIKSKSSGLG